MLFFKAASHSLNVVKSYFRAYGVPRSPHWPALEKKFLAGHPTCAACGGVERLNVHHCLPFHLFPELELDESNLITLCMGPLEDHLKLGHGGNFSAYVLEVRDFAAAALAFPNTRSDLETKAKLLRRFT